MGFVVRGGAVGAGRDHDSHSASLVACRVFFLRHTRSFHRRESMVLEKLGPVK